MKWHQYDFFYTDHIHVPLPVGHRFPMEKYRLLRESLIQENVLETHQLFPSPPASVEDLQLAHTDRYINGLMNQKLSDKELRPIGLTWSSELLKRSFCSVGGFIKTTESALEKGFSGFLAGGTHHAHADKGEGYCVFNDFAVAALRLLKKKTVRKILIIDLDVHQGNGNSSILGNHNDVFVFSIHGEKNYPFRKVPSHLDIALPEKTENDEYLHSLKNALSQLASQSFDIIFYQAGVDVLKEDSLGTFNLTFEGLIERDKMVFEFAKKLNLPIAMAMGGGYAKPIELTIKAHVNTYKIAREILG
jgi:acetoin utilization deacetylase AcuC-like enzyme